VADPGSPPADTRKAALEDWLGVVLGTTEFTLTPASEDASFRRYFRVQLTKANPLAGSAQSLIAMDAPPPREDCRPFVRVAALLTAAGVHAPEVLAQEFGRGFLLLSDLGTTTYLRALNDANADRLFADALDTVVRWQLATRPATLPPYDESLLRRELELFPEWYIGRHLGHTITADERAELTTVFDRIIASNLAQPTVYVHRDFMPRNLMVTLPNPGVLDFQDAVTGPITYDVASLFKDAYLSWPEERVLDWTIRYWERAKRAKLPVLEDFGAFWRDFEWMGLQRHLKVLGDGKSGYVEDTPRFLAYVRPVAERYPELAPLLRLLDRLERRTPTIGYTF
jgi:N-acetylmuramate 1-kinase